VENPSGIDQAVSAVLGQRRQQGFGTPTDDVVGRLGQLLASAGSASQEPADAKAA
jgi:hypothetical protein